MGGRSHKTLSGKEHDLLDKLKQENKTLKVTIKRLRKELESNKLNYDNVKDLLDEQIIEEIQYTKDKERQLLLKQWKCHKCASGYLKIIIMAKPDGPYYLRKCTDCVNRTKLQKYTDSIKGIKDDKEIN